jgi:hypothetical protein
MAATRYGLAAALVTTLVFAGSVYAADLVSEETKTGALVGAMKYCEENHAADSKEGRKYKRVMRDALKKMDGMSSNEKTRALLARKSAEDKGEYLGRELDQKRCEKIRKTAGLGAMRDKDKE